MFDGIQRLFRAPKRVGGKIKLADNQPLTDAEYALCCRICDTIAGIADAYGYHAPVGGTVWQNIEDSFYAKVLRGKDRAALNRTTFDAPWFRDYPPEAYEHDDVTPEPDGFVRRYVRLTKMMPVRFRVHVPARFGEVGWSVDGHPVNRFTGYLQARVNCMQAFGVLTALDRMHNPFLVEIGGGAGETGYFFCNAFPGCTWIDCDLPESLAISAMHLAVLLPNRRHFIYAGSTPLPASVDDTMVLRSPAQVASAHGAVIHVPNFLFDELSGSVRADLGFNSWSFVEMPQDVMANYATRLSQMLARRGMLVESNAARPNWVTDKIETRFALRDELNPGAAGPVRLWTVPDCATPITPAGNRARIVAAFTHPEDAVSEAMLAAWKKFPWSGHG